MSEEMLDRFLPAFDVAERHETQVPASAERAYGIASGLALQRSPLVRALFWAREFILRAPHEPMSAAPFVEQLMAMGWGVLDERPGRAIAFGAVTQPWVPHVQFRALAPEQFARFDEPGFVEIAWTIEAEPLPGGASRVRTVTRARATDAEARRRFRVYWALFSPGIRLIRWEALRLVRAQARREATRRALPAAAPPATRT